MINSFSKEEKIYYALRLAAAMCFIGHGAFGIITKAVWCNYFAVFGIGHDIAYRLMPVLGTFDILMGAAFLFYPVRAIALWLVIWGIVTASLRPLSGEPFAELIERAGNFGAPLALLLLCGTGKGFWSWFSLMKAPDDITPKQLKKLEMVLRCVAFLLLAGHGWLNLVEKKALLSQYASLGYTDAQRNALIVGLIEIAMALVVLIKPARPMLLIFLAWKIGTELFYPHWEILEWVERGGSYGVLLALWFTLEPMSLNERVKGWRTGKLANQFSFIFMVSLLMFAGIKYTTMERIDQGPLNQVKALDKQNHNATFVFVDPGFVNQISQNKFILLPPIGDNLTIDIDKYLHKGHNGPLYIIMPDSYAGPKEKMVLKSFPGYKGWYASMIGDTYVMYAAK